MPFIKIGTYGFEGCEDETINEKQHRIWEKARKILKEKFGDEAELPTELRPGASNYSDMIDYFRYLFGYSEECRTALWNSLWSGFQIDKMDFFDDEYEFLMEHRKAFESDKEPDTMNINEPIETERLVLRASDEKCIPDKNSADSLAFRRHLAEDGDFENYTGFAYSEDRLEPYCILSRTFHFVVEEKESGKMVGIVALGRYDENSRVAECEWYIFRPYRKKGYAKEAFSALCAKAFEGGLKRAVYTVRENIFEEGNIPVDIIRAEIRDDNIVSQKLAESCGFRHMATIRRGLTNDCGIHDALLYEKEK